MAVFASGSGTNFQALIDAAAEPDYPASIVCLVTDVPGCGAVARAAQAGIPAFVARPRDFADKAAFEAKVLEVLSTYQVEWIALAGYMRLIGPTLLSAYDGHILNIHPSLLPAFPGRHAIADAIAAGVPETGVTVHRVDAGIDTGPVIAQERVPVDPGMSAADLLARVHEVEHQLYPAVLRRVVRGEA
ncbi:phosphoribosylglycinamide formyltransferase [Alicyclobacillus sp. ALC3]|uniref:phosphoribosylglycinamide formyltransferase n=1 Tax=Alicyclobacillus sp. ALC3 TaxID=2796143 RepID=UPI0023787EB4|nr:phosphoribosylglycinamide formyltransferase [Alicyclobacillus sp. ALC3]WDL99499.1 phosphoribosylglycinamide formyltransferase [Alicyclobacillus sp. ALC3]